LEQHLERRDGDVLKPVFQMDGSLSMTRQLYLHTCSASIVQEGWLAKSKRIWTKTLERSELRWAHDEALVTLCRIAVVDQ